MAGLATAGSMFTVLSALPYFLRRLGSAAPNHARSKNFLWIIEPIAYKSVQDERSSAGLLNVVNHPPEKFSSSKEL